MQARDSLDFFRGPLLSGDFFFRPIIDKTPPLVVVGDSAGELDDVINTVPEFRA